MSICSGQKRCSVQTTTSCSARSYLIHRVSMPLSARLKVPHTLLFFLHTVVLIQLNSRCHHRYICLSSYGHMIDVLAVFVGHAYSVLKVVEYNGKRFVKVRNPWGSCEWGGAWS